MKAKKLLVLFLSLSTMTGFAVTKFVSTTNFDTFSPADTTISTADAVQFTIGGGHNVAEVSLATYGSPGGPAGTTRLPGGFFFDFGTATGTVSNLTPGTHYFVCQAHASMGMKGTITVTALGVNDFQLAKSFSVFPNPTTNFVNIKSNENLLNLPYAVIDQSGRMISAGKLNDITTSIDLSQLVSGIYFLQVGDDRKQTLRLIKK